MKPREVHVWTGRADDAGLARRVLSRYCGPLLHDRPIERSPLGRPFVVGSPVHFSVSRTAGLAVVAIARDPIGVDVERVVPLPELDALVGTCLDAREAAFFAQLPAGERTAFFYRCWTRKEACLKALGVGLTRDPRSVATLDQQGPWRWTEIPLEAGVALTVATSFERARVILATGASSQVTA